MRSGVRGFKLSCRDLGVDDDFVCHGKSRAEVISRMDRYLFRSYGIAFDSLWKHNMSRLIRAVF